MKMFVCDVAVVVATILMPVKPMEILSNVMDDRTNSMTRIQTSKRKSLSFDTAN